TSARCHGAIPLTPSPSPSLRAAIELDFICFTAPSGELFWQLPSRPQKRHPPRVLCENALPLLKGESTVGRQILRRSHRRREIHRTPRRPILRHHQSARRPTLRRQSFLRQSRHHHLSTRSSYHPRTNSQTAHRPSVLTYRETGVTVLGRDPHHSSHRQRR